jgi:hypothetical protein
MSWNLRVRRTGYKALLKYDFRNFLEGQKKRKDISCRETKKKPKELILVQRGKRGLKHNEILKTD